MFSTRFCITFILFCIASMTILAQDDMCPSLVEDALQAVSDQCDETGRNQVCYGNIQLDATIVEGVSDFRFDVPGDIADVAVIETLKLSVLQSPDEWGIALMKIQANLPDTVPGQNVTLLLFGDVLVENLADDGDDNEGFGPMQAVVFRNGVGESACEEAPQDGILIQTPSGAGTVTLDVNDVRIELGSTAFLNAVPDDVMSITMLDGEASVTALDVTIIVPAGARAEIPLGADGLANGIPEIVSYEADEIASLPIGNLEESIELPDPTASTTLEGDVSGDYLIPEPGTWCDANDPELECGDISDLILDINEEGITAELAGFIPRTGENTYALYNFEYAENFFDVEVEIISPTEITIMIADKGNNTTTVQTLVYGGD